MKGAFRLLGGVTVCSALSSQQVPVAAELDAIPELIRSGSLTEASSRVAAALEVHPLSPALHNFRGVVEAQRGRYDAAEADFARAISVAPRFTGAYLNLGRLYQENVAKDPQASLKAVRTYEQLLRLEPANTEAHYQLALLLLVRDSAQASLRYLAALTAPAAARPQALALRCAAEALLGQLEQANETARQLLDKSELTAADIETILPVLARRQLTALQITLLAGLDGRSQASPAMLQSLARAYENAGRMREARTAFERAGSEHSPNAALLLNLARVAYKEKDYQGALGYLAHARDLEPQNPAIHFFFGVVLIEMDLPLEADRSLSQAAELDSRNPFVAYALGAVKCQMRKWDQAAAWFERYCRLKPDDPHGKLALASTYFATMADDKARKELEAPLKEPRTAAAAHYYTGRLALRANDFAAGLAELRKAVALEPKDADAWSELGFAYLERKEYDLARRALERSLALNPKVSLRTCDCSFSTNARGIRAPRRKPSASPSWMRSGRKRRATCYERYVCSHIEVTTMTAGPLRQYPLPSS
jgi:Flp pilus assembly protein TadD